MKHYEHQYVGTNPHLFLHVIRTAENLSAALTLGRNDAIVTFAGSEHLRELAEVLREAVEGPDFGFGTSPRFWLCQMDDGSGRHLLHIAPTGVQLTLTREELKEMYDIFRTPELLKS